MNTTSTADPHGARSHARAMGSTRVESMPTVPAGSATDLPTGVTAEDMLWHEVIAGGGYAFKQLQRGARLQLTDVYGDACASMLIFNADYPAERLNIADTVKVQWNAYLKQYSLLLSDMGRSLMSVLEDSAGTHDTFCGASNKLSNATKYGSGENWSDTPNTRDRFLLAVTKAGLTRRDIHPCMTWFKAVHISEDGSTVAQIGPFPPQRSVTLRADMNVIVVIANCPHPLDPRPDYTVTPLRVQAWSGVCADANDPARTAGPEAMRAFLNVDEYFRR